MSTTKTAEPLIRGHPSLKTTFSLSRSLSFLFFNEPFLRISNKQTSYQAIQNTFSWSLGWSSETGSTITVSADYDMLPTVHIQTIMWKACGTSTARNTAKKQKTQHRHWKQGVQSWNPPHKFDLLPSRRVLCTPYNPAPCHFMQSNIRKVYACLAVTCHLHFWQDDWDLLQATAVTQGRSSNLLPSTNLFYIKLDTSRINTQGS